MNKPFWGKYRGKVVDNADPLKIGRIKPLVPALSDFPLPWAMPCTPYAGMKTGLYTIPPIDANIWIEFEGGDPGYPIWAGGFWGTDEAVTVPPAATDPQKKVLQTEKITLVMDDESQEFKVSMDTENNGTMSLVINPEGITLTANKVTVTLTPENITLKTDQASVKVDQDVTLTKSAATVTVSNSITLKNGGASAEIAQAAIDLKNGGASINMNPAIVNINNGALEVM